MQAAHEKAKGKVKPTFEHLVSAPARKKQGPVRIKEADLPPELAWVREPT